MLEKALLSSKNSIEQKTEVYRIYKEGRMTYSLKSTFKNEVSLSEVIYHQALEKITQL